MSMIAKKKVIGIKQEATQGSPETLAATDFIEAYDIETNPDADVLEAPYNSASLDPFPQKIGKRWQEIKFKIDLKGSGAAGTAIAPLGAALQACGMIETVSAGVSVTYAPTTAPASANYCGPGKSVTIKLYEDGLLSVLAGCIGDLNIIAEAGKPCVLEFTFKGIYAPVADASMAATTLLATIAPVCISSSLALQTYAAVAAKFDIQFNNVIAQRDSLSAPYGIWGFMIVDRKPGGSCDPEAVTVATHDYFGKFISGVAASSSIVVGSVAGNITTITMPKTQYGKIGKANRGEIMTFTVPMKFSRTSGDDWMSFVQT